MFQLFYSFSLNYCLSLSTSDVCYIKLSFLVFVLQQDNFCFQIGLRISCCVYQRSHIKHRLHHWHQRSLIRLFRTFFSCLTLPFISRRDKTEDLSVFSLAAKISLRFRMQKYVKYSKNSAISKRNLTFHPMFAAYEDIILRRWRWHLIQYTCTTLCSHLQAVMNRIDKDVTTALFSCSKSRSLTSTRKPTLTFISMQKLGNGKWVDRCNIGAIVSPKFLRYFLFYSLLSR